MVDDDGVHPRRASSKPLVFPESEMCSDVVTIEKSVGFLRRPYLLNNLTHIPLRPRTGGIVNFGGIMERVKLCPPHKAEE